MTESSCVEYKFKLNDSFERGFVSFLNSDGGRILARLKGLGVVVHVGSVQHGHWEVSEEAKESIK